MIYGIISLVVIAIIIAYFQYHKSPESQLISQHGAITFFYKGSDHTFLFAKNDDGIHKLKRMVSYVRSNRFKEFLKSDDRERLEHQDSINFSYLVKSKPDYKKAEKLFKSMTTLNVKSMEVSEKNNKYTSTLINK